MKGAETFVVSLRGVNFGFLTYLGCSGQNAKKSFYLLDSCNQSLKSSLLGSKKVGPRPD